MYYLFMFGIRVRDCFVKYHVIHLNAKMLFPVVIWYGWYGRVEYWVDGTYDTRQPICDEEWDDVDATVLCRERGFDGGKAVTRGSIDPWNVGGSVQSGFNCSGSESRLLDCPHTTKSCGYNNADVVCYRDSWDNSKFHIRSHCLIDGLDSSPTSTVPV